MPDTGRVTWEEAVLKLRGDPGQAELVKACFYDDPLIEAARRYENSSEWRALEALLPADKGDVLDLGAGRGIASYAMAKQGWSVVAVEPDQSLIVGSGAIRSLAEETGLQISVTESFGESLPFEKESFDLVHCRAVLHHANDLSRLCCEIARVLRPGGTMVATREHVISRQSDRDKFLDMHPLHCFYGGENAFTVQTYLSAIDCAGLRVDRIIKSFESDINLYPDSLAAIKRRLTERMGFSVSQRWVGWLFKCRGYFDRTPGRLYTFVAKKP